MATIKFYVPDGTTPVVGDCFNSLKGEFLHFKAIAGLPPVVDRDPTPAVGFECTVVSSSQQLMEAFDLTASAGASGLWGSASAKSEYHSEHALDEFSTYVVVRSVVICSTEDLADRGELVQCMADNAKTHFNPKSWMDLYGDTYIKSIARGGEFIAVLRYDTRTEQDQSVLKTQLDVATAGFVSADADFASKMKNVTTTASLAVKIMATGVKGIKEIKIDDLMQAGLNFTTDVFATPAVVFIKVRTYEDVFPYRQKAPVVPEASREAALALVLLKKTIEGNAARIAASRKSAWKYPVETNWDDIASQNQAMLARIGPGYANSWADALSDNPFACPSVDAQTAWRKAGDETLAAFPKFRQPVRMRALEFPRAGLSGYMTLDSESLDSICHVLQKTLNQQTQMFIIPDSYGAGGPIVSWANGEFLRTGPEHSVRFDPYGLWTPYLSSRPFDWYNDGTGHLFIAPRDADGSCIKAMIYDNGYIVGIGPWRNLPGQTWQFEPVDQLELR